MASNDNMIAALLRERDGYVRRNLDDRVKQVDEQLGHLGYAPEGEQRKGPKGRSSTPQQTADQGKKPPSKRAPKKTAAAPLPETSDPGDAATESTEQTDSPSAE